MASARSSGVKSIRSSIDDTLAIERRRLGGKRLRARGTLSRHIGRGNGPLFDRPDGPPRRAIEDERKRLLRELDDGPDRLVIDADVHEDRRSRQVVVPEIVMNDLIVPHSLAVRAPHAHERVGEEVVARPMPSVHVARRRGQRKVGEPCPFVDADQRPQVGVAAVRPGVVLPCLAADLAGTRYRIEPPARLAGAHVEGLYDAGHAFLCVGRSFIDAPMPTPTMTTSRQTWGAPVHAYPVARGPRPARRSIRPASPNPATGLPVRRIEGNQILAANHQETPVVPLGPERHAARARAPKTRLPLVGKGLLNPEGLAGARMKGFDQADAVRAVQHAAHHQRCRAEVARIGELGILRGDARVNRGAPPGDAQPRSTLPCRFDRAVNIWWCRHPHHNGTTRLRVPPAERWR